MNSSQIYAKTAPVKLFFMIAIPGAISMIASSLWGLFDGIFVGNILGETAFAALNLAFPLVLINFSLADLIGVGSAVNISIFLGKEDHENANNYFTCAALMIFIVGCIIRNEREFHIYSFEDGERFEPDYVLFLQRDKTDGFEQLQILSSRKVRSFSKRMHGKKNSCSS